MTDRPLARPDRAFRILLTGVVILLGVIAVELSDRGPALLPAAVAQIPDTAKQRADILSETKRTNELLGQILDHLRGKSVKVVVTAADKPGGEATGRTRSP